VAYKEFYKTLCSALHINALFISIPYFIAGITIGILNVTGLAKNISKENLLGLKNTKPVDTRNDLKMIGIQISDYKTSIERVSK
jgi:hypothetical protein